VAEVLLPAALLFSLAWMRVSAFSLYRHRSKRRTQQHGKACFSPIQQGQSRSARMKQPLTDVARYQTDSSHDVCHSCT
jgi:hypothetical protein